MNFQSFLLFRSLVSKKKRKETLYIFPVILEAELNAEVGDLRGDALKRKN